MRSSSGKESGSRPPKRPRMKDDEINSDELNSDAGDRSEVGSDDFFEMEEDPNSNEALAKKFLEGMGAGEESLEKLGERLQRESDMIARKVHHRIANTFTFDESKFYKGHKLPATCIALSGDERYAYTGGKDCAMIRWDLETGAKDVFPGGRKQFDCGGHFEQVLSVSVADDENLIITGGADSLVRLWDVRAPKARSVAELRGHTGAVTGVVAEPGNTRMMYSCSKDRTLRQWNLNMRAFMQLMCGHTDDVIAMDIQGRDKPLTVSSDRTVRLWKASNDSHYVFHAQAPGQAHGAGFECAALINANKFVSGGVDGSLALWSTSFKKPIAVAEKAHMAPITSVAAVASSDLVFTGSSDGVIRAWQADQGDVQAAIKANNGEKISTAQHKKLLTQGVLAGVSQTTVDGFTNAMAVANKGRFLVAATAKEPRLGRWEVQKGARNGIQVISFAAKNLDNLLADEDETSDLE